MLSVRYALDAVSQLTIFQYDHISSSRSCEYVLLVLHFVFHVALV